MKVTTMNLLYDFISTQGFINGGAEYDIRVFETLQSRGVDIHYFCLFDDTKSIVYADYTPKKLMERFKNVTIVYTYEGTIISLVKKYHINKVFIAIGQRYFDVPFQKIGCPVKIVVHDASLLETADCHIQEYLDTYKPELSLYRIARHRLKLFFKKPIPLETNDKRFFDNVRNANNVELIAVSEYSKNSIILYGSLSNTKISVLYSPAKLSKISANIENEYLSNIIAEKSKYLLFVSANRAPKNPLKGISAFKRFKKLYHSDLKLVTIGFNGTPQIHDHLNLPYLSASDLEYAYKNCYALFYPSFFEGFGYPPLEAMKYGKPVLASNVTSIPEILGDSAIYFSPFYEADMVKAFLTLESSYEKYASLASERYKIISEKQKADLESLCEKIESVDNE